MEKQRFENWTRFILRRGAETWITATPWIGAAVVRFDVADSRNCHLRWEYMSREEFDRLQ